MPELVFRAKVGESYGNRLSATVVIQVDDALLAPMGRPANDVDLLTAERQKGMCYSRLCC
jgi:hypothetical protein